MKETFKKLNQSPTARILAILAVMVLLSIAMIGLKKAEAQEATNNWVLTPAYVVNGSGRSTMIGDRVSRDLDYSTCNQLANDFNTRAQQISTQMSPYGKTNTITPSVISAKCSQVYATGPVDTDAVAARLAQHKIPGLGHVQVYSSDMFPSGPSNLERHPEKQVRDTPEDHASFWQQRIQENRQIPNRDPNLPDVCSSVRDPAEVCQIAIVKAIRAGKQIQLRDPNLPKECSSANDSSYDCAVAFANYRASKTGHYVSDKDISGDVGSTVNNASRGVNRENRAWDYSDDKSLPEGDSSAPETRLAHRMEARYEHFRPVPAN